MNSKAFVLILLLMVLTTIMFTRWEAVPGDGPYPVKRDRLTSIEREYLPGRHVYPTEQARYIVRGAGFFLLAVMGLTVNELYKEMGWRRAPEPEQEIDLITSGKFYGWGKVAALLAVVVMVVVLIFILKTIPKLQ